MQNVPALPLITSTRSHLEVYSLERVVHSEDLDEDARPIREADDEPRQGMEFQDPPGMATFCIIETKMLNPSY